MMCLGVRPDIFEGKNITQKWMSTDEITIDDGSLMASWQLLGGEDMGIPCDFFPDTSGVFGTH